MKTFAHIDATTLEAAASALASPKAMAIAGGTDLIGTLKFGVLPDVMYPATIVNLKTIPALD